eukprot:259297_1
MAPDEHTTVTPNDLSTLNPGDTRTENADTTGITSPSHTTRRTVRFADQIIEMHPESTTEPSSNVPACLVKDDRSAKYECLKFLICIVVLLPIKLVLAILVMPIIYLLQKIALTGLSSQDIRDSVESRPIRVFSKWRRAMLMPTRIACRINLLGMSFWCIDVKGKLDPDVSIMVCNHVSYNDILVMLWHANPAMAAKKDVLKEPIISDYVKVSQSLTVDRDDQDSRSRMQREIIRRAKLPPDERFLPMCIFPEGTSTNGKAMLRFKLGAFRPGVPIQPVLLRYSSSNYSPTYPFYARQKDGKLAPFPTISAVLRGYFQFAQYLEVEYLPVYRPSEMEQSDAKLFASNVQSLMAEQLGVPVVDWSFY